MFKFYNLPTRAIITIGVSDIVTKITLSRSRVPTVTGTSGIDSIQQRMLKEVGAPWAAT